MALGFAAVSDADATDCNADSLKCTDSGLADYESAQSQLSTSYIIGIGGSVLTAVGLAVFT